ncbi:MAG: GNAT family N-acetyltransferase [Candidatus Omnitrophota bacterium]|nr:GNAT family N-acetyltransferase [Candidatus Omnitrophota bacterium]
MDANIVVREATLEDRREIWEWWNDPVTRRMMKKNDVVPWEEHCAWFDGVLKDPGRILCVGFVDGEKAGNVRFDFQGEGVYEVSVNMNPQLRGRGYGPLLVGASIAYLNTVRPVTTLIAMMKKINPRSRKTFERNGFVVKEPTRDYPRMVGRFSPEEEWYSELIYGGKSDAGAFRAAASHAP